MHGTLVGATNQRARTKTQHILPIRSLTCGSWTPNAYNLPGIRPAARAARLQHQKRASHPVTQARMSEEIAGEGALDRGSFLRNSAVFLGAVAAVRPDSAAAIGELFEFKNQTRFAQHVTVQVPDMDAALKFYTQGVGMRVLRTRAGPEFNTTVVGFGPENLQVPPDFLLGVNSMSSYGGHFTLELNSQKEMGAEGEEDIDFFYDPGNGVKYVQIAVDSYRISQVIKSGGIIESGYGHLQVLAPGGLRVKILSGDRRDPPMFTAVKVKDLQKSIQWYTDIAGMTKFPYPLARAPGSPFEPEQPKNSVFMAYEANAFGMVLVPAAKDERLNVGSILSLSVLVEDVDKTAEDLGGRVDVDSFRGGERSVSVADPDGYVVKFVEYSNWRKGLPRL